MPLLELRNIETYYGPIMAIRGVSLKVDQSDIVTILGANGAGKTTVLKTISAAMEAQKGSVTFAGEDITGLDPDRVARLGIGHVPEGREVFPFLTVDENLRMGAYSRTDGDTGADVEMVYGYFPVLADQRKLAAGFLSGGQQQIARHRSRPHAPAAPHAARRAVPRPVARSSPTRSPRSSNA